MIVFFDTQLNEFFRCKKLGSFSPLFQCWLQSIKSRCRNNEKKNSGEKATLGAHFSCKNLPENSCRKKAIEHFLITISCGFSDGTLLKSYHCYYFWLLLDFRSSKAFCRISSGSALLISATDI